MLAIELGLVENVLILLKLPMTVELVISVIKIRVFMYQQF